MSLLLSPRSGISFAWSLSCILTVGSFVGCNPGELANLQAENKRLSERSQAQLSEIENLKVHARQVEDQLLTAEQQLASSSAGRAVASRQALAGAGVSATTSRQLAALAEQYSYLHYDPQTGIAKVDTDILFDSGDAKLKPGAQQLLQQLVAVLQSPSGRDLKIMVVGHTDDQRIKGPESLGKFPNNWHLSTARANNVADRLRTLGLDGKRMGVAGFGQFQSIATNESPQQRQQNRRVEIFLTAPDVPIVGMTETMTNLY
jgi:chemotaxis protein MotB